MGAGCPLEIQSVTSSAAVCIPTKINGWQIKRKATRSSNRLTNSGILSYIIVALYLKYDFKCLDNIYISYCSHYFCY